MDFDTALAATSPRHGGGSCTVCAALDALDDDQRAKAAKAMSNPAVQSRQISDAFDALNLTVDPSRIARHRRGDCLAGRTA